VTTRIKGILSKGQEVELGLLGMEESIDLLRKVAELDKILPEVCEIVVLCGKLQSTMQSVMSLH
jgi:hypothetical protein